LILHLKNKTINIRLIFKQSKSKKEKTCAQWFFESIKKSIRDREDLQMQKKERKNKAMHIMTFILHLISKRLEMNVEFSETKTVKVFHRGF